MSHKIFKNAFLICILVLALCVGMFFSMMYTQLEEQVYSELRIEAAYIAEGLSRNGEGFLAGIAPERRVTWVNEKGDVIYDNKADTAMMENHMDREEIVEAFSTGSGRGRHYSGTMSETTLYYAQLLEDGTVVRVAATHDSVLAMLIDMLRPIFWTVVLILLVCGILSSRLARQITGPINALDLDDPLASNPYKELYPLANRVLEQNRTIRKQMDELSMKQREFAVITENMSEGLILVDNKGFIVFSNQSGIDFIAIGREEVRAISRARCLAEVCDGVEAALAGQRSENIITRDERSIQLITNPVISSGQVTGAIVLALDVTEREQRDELRREFSANVSHELKTPLTSISGFAELMKEGIVPAEKMQEFSQDIYDESCRMISMIEDIIMLSRIDEDSSIPDYEDVDMLALSRSVAESLRPTAEKSGVLVSVDGERAVLRGIRQILSELVFNLCENAIKYNHPGGTVKINVSSGGGEVRLSVKDTGIGIPEEARSRIFERFYRVDKSHSKEIGGTGLGLSIVRHAAKFHNARIELISEVGKGSEFLIHFPVKEKQ